MVFLDKVSKPAENASPSPAAARRLACATREAFIWIATKNRVNDVTE